MAAVISVLDAQNEGITKTKWTVVSAADGSGSKVSPAGYFGAVLACVTIPAGGGSAPSAGWDVTITDPEGYDVLQGAGADRSAADTETATPAKTSVAFGELTLNVANMGNAKGATVILYTLGAKRGGV